MKEKFKHFLQTEFQKIPPTKASMEYRKKLLGDLLDYAQELKLKGISNNDEIIYDLAIQSLGNMDVVLQDFEDKRRINHKLSKKNLAAAITSAAIIIPTILIYLIASFVFTGIWAWSWIIILGGSFATTTALIMLYIINNKTKLSALYVRVGVLAIVTLWMVFCALVLLLINNHVPGANIKKWYIVFIGLPAMLALTDMILAIATSSKGRWINVAFDMVVVFTMLYVILGLLITNFWHPGWLIILAGVGFSALELIIVIRVKKKREARELGDENEINEKFYTEW